jgi:hypothetical protein
VLSSPLSQVRSSSILGILLDEKIAVRKTHNSTSVALDGPVIVSLAMQGIEWARAPGY